LGGAFKSFPECATPPPPHLPLNLSGLFPPHRLHLLGPGTTFTTLLYTFSFTGGPPPPPPSLRSRIPLPNFHSFFQGDLTSFGFRTPWWLSPSCSRFLKSLLLLLVSPLFLCRQSPPPVNQPRFFSTLFVLFLQVTSPFLTWGRYPFNRFT